MLVRTFLAHIREAADLEEVGPDSALGVFVRDPDVPVEDDQAFRVSYVADCDLDDEDGELALEVFDRSTGEPLTSAGMTLADLVRFVTTQPSSIGDYHVFTAHLLKFDETHGAVEHTPVLGTMTDVAVDVFGAIQAYDGYEADVPRPA